VTENLTRDEAVERGRLIADPRYEVILDLAGDDEDGFDSTTVVRFRCTEPGASSFLDLVARSVSSIILNGREVPLEAFARTRVTLDGLQAENEVRIQARCFYQHDGTGMTRFVDPVDGAIYRNSDFEPYDARKGYACFDQPDIKGTFVFEVLAPEGSTVLSNMPPVAEPDDEMGVRRWRFAETLRIPSYITAVVEGPFHQVRDRHGEIDLGLFCRDSLAAFLDADELMEITKQGFDFYQKAFGYPYPFAKYDQVFVPDYTAGAMENAGCVTFNEHYIFRSRETDAVRERRADTVLHEMAHMWFGDLVTMKWWNDLWLNESFASFASVLALTNATRFKEAWATFAEVEKNWAYREDQLPTTHPIVADIPDVESVHLNFDGITYAKGASVLKQLVAWVGEDRFLEGMRGYFRRFEFANAELDDFLNALEEVSGRDLHAWSKEWLEAAGVNTLHAEAAGENGNLGSVQIVQTAPAEWPTIRPHRLAIGLYDAEGDAGLKLRRRVELDVTGERTEVPELAGEAVPDLLLVNDLDLTYAKVRLDERSLRTLDERLSGLPDALGRAVCWGATWDMTRDGELAAREYLRLVLRHAEQEPKVGLVQALQTQAVTAVEVLGDPANRNAAIDLLASDALETTRRAEAGSDHQLAWARTFISSARTPEHLDLVQGLLDGTEVIDGLKIDTELRWTLVRALAASGRAGEAEIAAELQRDATDAGKRRAAAARAARPTEEAKAEAWRAIVEDTQIPLAMATDMMRGFAQYGQEELLKPYVARYFEALGPVWENREFRFALVFGRQMYPHTIVSEETVAATDAYLEGDVPAPIRRLLLEGRDGIQRALRARAVDAAAG
jgi:aminopeptidase N